MVNPPSTSNPSPAVSTSASAAGPASGDGYEELKKQFTAVVSSGIGRIAVALTVLAVPLLTGLCAWLQKELGIHLDPAELATFIATMGAGIVISGYKWISNRGEWERGIVDAYGAYLTGQAAIGHQVALVASVAAPANGAQAPAKIDATPSTPE